VIQAATGMMALQGSGAGEPPIKVGFPVIDIATGISAAEAILAAIVRRLRGDAAPITLDVSMIDSALALMSGPAANTLATGKSPERVGNRGFVGSPGAETFATRDGHISVAANTMGQFATLCRLLGRSELAKHPDLPAGLSKDAFLANTATDALREELAQAFAVAEAGALETELNEAGVPSARVRDLAEYLHEIYPHTPGIGIDGEPLALGPAFRWVDAAASALPSAPQLGADTDQFTVNAPLASRQSARARELRPKATG
jgi:crotonobetainyl-CoA:carnitine CoA-transferase CaiB-like acyl-CoA transferase